MNKKRNDISGVILAGGKNSRINTEKSLLKIDNHSLIENTLNELKKVFNQIIIVSNKQNLRDEFPHEIFIKDIYKNCGPLAGIHSALKHVNNQAVFVVACDMPFIDKFFINQQVELYDKMKHKYSAIVPRHKEGIEPLHAIYSIDSLKFIDANLSNNVYSVRSFFEKINVYYMELCEKCIKYFYNINTHDEFIKTKKQKYSLCNCLRAKENVF